MSKIEWIDCPHYDPDLINWSAMPDLKTNTELAIFLASKISTRRLPPLFDENQVVLTDGSIGIFFEDARWFPGCALWEPGHKDGWWYKGESPIGIELPSMKALARLFHRSMTPRIAFTLPTNITPKNDWNCTMDSWDRPEAFVPCAVDTGYGRFNLRYLWVLTELSKYRALEFSCNVNSRHPELHFSFDGGYGIVMGMKRDA
jgi:hypothetical protein